MIQTKALDNVIRFANKEWSQMLLILIAENETEAEFAEGVTEYSTSKYGKFFIAVDCNITNIKNPTKFLELVKNKNADGTPLFIYNSEIYLTDFAELNDGHFFPISVSDFKNLINSSNNDADD